MPLSVRHLLFAIGASVTLHVALGAYLFLSARQEPESVSSLPAQTATSGTDVATAAPPAPVATAADVRRAIKVESATVDQLSDAQKADAIQSKLGRLNRIDDQSIDQIVSAVEAVTGAATDSRPTQPLGLNQTPGAFDDRTARYFAVDDSKIDPATGRRFVVFTQIDVGRRTRTLTVAEDELTPYQKLQRRQLKEDVHDDAGNHINEVNLFDHASGRMYDITRQTNPDTGAVSYKLTLLDKNGRTLSVVRGESEMSGSDRALFRVFEMKRSNPKLGKIIEAASRIAEARAAEQAAESKQPAGAAAEP